MKICQPHWERIRKAIADRGMAHLGAKSGQEAMKNTITELEGRAAENDFDPLMGCNNMIWSKGLESCGLALMAKDDLCPICEAVKSYEEWWISGPADAMLKEAKDQGLVP